MTIVYRDITERTKLVKFEEVVRGRRSIRGYKPDPVPQKVIGEVIELV